MRFESPDELLKRFILSLAVVWGGDKEIKELRSTSIKSKHFDWDLGWRPVSDELPKPIAASYSKIVLVIVESIAGKKSINIDRYDWDNECWEILHYNSGVECEAVTHWMPLPVVV
jgi:hypothetical protein